jgi:hypothetical protein
MNTLTLIDWPEASDKQKVTIPCGKVKADILPGIGRIPKIE